MYNIYIYIPYKSFWSSYPLKKNTRYLWGFDPGSSDYSWPWSWNDFSHAFLLSLWHRPCTLKVTGSKIGSRKDANKPRLSSFGHKRYPLLHQHHGFQMLLERLYAVQSLPSISRTTLPLTFAHFQVSHQQQWQPRLGCQRQAVVRPLVLFFHGAKWTGTRRKSNKWPQNPSKWNCIVYTKVPPIICPLQRKESKNVEQNKINDENTAKKEVNKCNKGSKKACERERENNITDMMLSILLLGHHLQCLLLSTKQLLLERATPNRTRWDAHCSTSSRCLASQRLPIRSSLVFWWWFSFMIKTPLYVVVGKVSSRLQRFIVAF